MNRYTLKKMVKTLAPSLLIGAAFLYWASSKRSSTGKEYAALHKTAEKEDNERNSSSLARVPQLHPSYDGQIAQRDIALRNVRLAKKIAHKGATPFHTFTSISIDITEGKIEEGLSRSEELLPAIEKSAPLLAAYTALRIATLRHRLGNKEGARDMLAMLERMPAAKELKQSLGVETFSLQQ